jgi:hypothetical protein
MTETHHDIDRTSTDNPASDDVNESKNTDGGISMFGAGQKGMSELEKAVLRRRQAMDDPDLSRTDVDDNDIRVRTIVCHARYTRDRCTSMFQR